ERHAQRLSVRSQQVAELIAGGLELLVGNCRGHRVDDELDAVRGAAKRRGHPLTRSRDVDGQARLGTAGLEAAVISQGKVRVGGWAIDLFGHAAGGRVECRHVGRAVDSDRVSKDERAKLVAESFENRATATYLVGGAGQLGGI